MTQKNNKDEEGMSVGGAVAIGAGVIAASAGAYYLAGPDGKKHRKAVLKSINKAEEKIADGFHSAVEKGKNFAEDTVEVVKEVIKNNSDY
jgi:gas vesicle protein